MICNNYFHPYFPNIAYAIHPTDYALVSWWRHQTETFSALLALCAGNSPVTGEFPSQRPVTGSFDVSLVCAWINGWVNNCKAGNLRHHRAHYDVIVMLRFVMFCRCPAPVDFDHNHQAYFTGMTQQSRVHFHGIHHASPSIYITREMCPSGSINFVYFLV